MRRFISKLLGRAEAKNAAQPDQPKEIGLDDVTAWMAGEADEATRSAIAKELDDPGSPTRRHLAWQTDPHKHRRGKGEPPPDTGAPGRSR